MEETISLQDLFKTLKKRLGLIALITIIAITISGVVSFWLLTPIYQSSTQILVTTSKTDQQQQNNSQEIQANLQLINTYNVIIKSPAILGIVKEELNLDRSVGALINQVTVNSAQNSQVVNIQVQDEDPKMAVDLANKIATVFQQEIQELMNVDNVNILTPAELGANPSPVKPDPMLNMAIAAVIGLMLGVGIAFLLEYLDTTMKDEQDVEEILNLPIIGLISPIPDSDIAKMKVEVTQKEEEGGEDKMVKKARKKKAVQTAARKVVTSVNPKSVVSEQFRTMRTNINFSLPDGELKTLLITSASPGDGKSTISANTAVVFAQEGKRVLLVDADMRKPTVHYTFHLTNTLGLSNLLTRQADLSEAINTSDTEGLDIITCGPIPPNPAELLGSQTMDKLIEQMKNQYDIIIFDAPPVLSVTDAQTMSNKCDGTVLVLSASATEKESIVKAKEALVTSQAKILGAVLNNFELDKDHYYYQYYGTGE